MHSNSLNNMCVCVCVCVCFEVLMPPLQQIEPMFWKSMDSALQILSTLDSRASHLKKTDKIIFLHLHDDVEHVSIEELDK